MLKSTLFSLGLVGALVTDGPAWAVTTTMTLNGDASSVTFNSYVGGGDLFNTALLALTSVSPLLPLTIVQGDIINATVSLSNGPFTVPASPQQFIGLNFDGLVPPSYLAVPGLPPVVEGSFVFKLLGATVATTTGNCGNCPSLLSYAGPGAELSFDSIEATLTFGNLTVPHQIVSASLSYQLSQPVPEPATWALWAMGLGALGTRARRQRA